MADTMQEDPLSDVILTEVKKAFSMIDRDGSGTITVDELGNLMRAVLGENISQGDVSQMMNIIDKDGNGTISQDEFIRAVATWLMDDMSGKSFSPGARKRKRGFDAEDRAEVHKRIKGFFSQTRTAQSFDEIQRNIERETEEVFKDVNLRMSADSVKAVRMSSQQKLEVLNHARHILDNIKTHIANLMSGNPYQQIEGAKHMAILLSIVEVFPSASERRQIGDLLLRIFELFVQENIAACLVQLLKNTQSPQLQMEACRCITYFAPGPRIAGTPVNSPVHPSKMFFKKILLQDGLVEALIGLLSNSMVPIQVREQVILCVGVIASENYECRDFIIASAAVPVLAQYIDSRSNLSTLQVLSWTLSILCGVSHDKNHQPSLPHLEPVLGKIVEMMIHVDDEEVKCNCIEAMRLILMGVPNGDVLQHMIALLVCKSVRVQICTLEALQSLIEYDERQYEFLVRSDLFLALKQVFKHSDTSVRQQALQTLVIIAEKREHFGQICKSGIIESLVDILSKDEQLRQRAVKLFLSMSRGNAEVVSYLVKVGVLKMLGHCLSFFKTYDDVLTNVYSFCGASYDFDFVRDIIGAMHNFVNVGAMQAEESSTTNKVALCFDMGIIDRIIDLLNVINSAEGDELKSWRHQDPNQMSLEDSIKSLLNKIYKAHRHNKEARSHNVCSMITDVWKKHFSDTTSESYDKAKILVKSYFRKEPVSVEEVSCEISFKDFLRKMEHKYDRPLQLTYQNNDDEVIRIDNDVSLRQAIKSAQKKSNKQKSSEQTLKIQCEPLKGSSSPDMLSSSPSLGSAHFGSPTNWKSSWAKDDDEMGDIDLAGLSSSKPLLPALVPSLKINDSEVKGFSLQEDLERTQEKEQNALLKDLEKNTKYSLDELRKLMDHWKGQADKNGKVSKEQFAEGMKQLGVTDPLMIDSNFRVFDRDRSGEVDFKEYVLGLSVFQRGSPEERLKLLFSMYDTDGSGSLTFDEIYNIYKAASRAQGKSTNHDVVLQEAQNCMKRADVNGDGEVDFEEFKKAVQSNSVEILFELEI